MKCPNCASEKTKVVRSRTNGAFKIRVRVCEDCGRTFETKEIPVAYLAFAESCNMSAKKTNGTIYFVQAVENNLIKIGFTTNFKKRFKDLVTMSPIELKALKIISGDRKIERKIHKKFDQCRKYGEWFEASEELLKYINSL